MVGPRPYQPHAPPPRSLQMAPLCEQIKLIGSEIKMRKSLITVLCCSRSYTKTINAVFLLSGNLSFIYSYLLDNIHAHPVQQILIQESAKTSLPCSEILNNLKALFNKAKTCETANACGEMKWKQAPSCGLL